jgi:iron complex transport system substrate-binding protein
VSVAAWVVVVASLLATIGCDPGGDPRPISTGDPQRVVVLAPAAAEMLERLDLLDRVVGIGKFGPWPAAIAERPVVGGYDDPNTELILELGADLVLTAASEAGAAAHRQLESLGVRVLALDTSTFDGVFRSLQEVGRVFGKQEKASELVHSIQERLSALERRASALPRRRVLFVVGRDPLYVAGPGSHVDRMIQIAGGENLAHDALSPYQQVSLETMLERMPEVIVDTSDNRATALRGRDTGAWGRWEFLPAVKNGRVYQVEPGRLVIPGVRLPEMTELMARLVHPETFGEPSPTDLGAAIPAVAEQADDSANP